MLRIQSRPRLARSRGGNIVVGVLLLLMGLFMALPIAYAVFNAFKPIGELFIFPPRLFVKQPTLDNFRELASLSGDMLVAFERYVFNSAVVTLVGTSVYVLIACLAAYPLAKHRFPGKTIILQLVVWAILFRPEVTAVPQFVIISRLGMIDTYAALIFPTLAGTFGVFLVRQFILGIPNEILEAARIDGLGEMGIFWRIIMPLTKSAWVTLIIFTFQGLWGNTGNQYVYSENLKVLPMALQQLSTAGLSRAGVGSAVVLLLMIPPILIFLLCQKSVMQAMAHSGIKA